jgi:hypothetical protein
MAKRKKRRTRAVTRQATMPADEAARAAAVPVIAIPQGSLLEVVVIVGPMVIPYTVAYDGRTVIKSLVDRAEPVTVKPGSFLLAWSFAHAVKEWSHSIGFSIDGGPVEILETKSEAKKDPDHSVGFALVRA